MQTILLTGGSGFLGRHIAGSINKLHQYKLKVPSRKQFDFTKLSDAVSASKNVDVIIHGSGLVLSRVEQQKRPGEVFFQNFAPILNIAEAGRVNKVKKIIYISSMTAYGESVSSPLSEGNLWQDMPVKSNFAYGLAKRFMDTATLAYSSQYGIEAACLIFPNLYGPEDKFNFSPPPLVASIVSQVYNAKAAGANEILAGDNGKQGIDLLYISDAAEAVVHVLEMPKLTRLMNVGVGKPILIEDIFRLVAKKLEYKGKIIWQKPKTKPKSRYLDISSMKKQLKWQPKIKFEKGIDLTIEWYLKNLK